MGREACPPSPVSEGIRPDPIRGRPGRWGDSPVPDKLPRSRPQERQSTLASAIALYLLYADREIGAQVYSVAYSRQQSSIIFAESAKMIRQNAKLYDRCRIMDSTKRIVVPRYGSVYAALSAD